MDYMSNKALIIAVSLFVTMAIASAVLFTINQVKTVYKQVYETDVSIQSSFSEFDEYDDTLKTGLDMVNTAKKYKDNPSVYVVNKNKDYFPDTDNDETKKSKAADKINTDEGVKKLVADLNVGSREFPTNASVPYKTYVLKLDDDSVIIGFIKQ